ncbi:MAG: porphobilinogen synthase [Deltaproteobacteria bacterium]|jgi:porphobilinogen synthase|nr:porphobilinogen synthase [Deltaproteobacteria bacterium]
MPFPYDRPRRLRENPSLRDLLRETRLAPEDLVYPIFIEPGKGVKNPIGSMPGQFRLSPDTAGDLAAEFRRDGGRALILFGIPDRKDPAGSSGADPSGPVQTAIREIKSRAPDLIVATDVCLCEYTSHGHCGVLSEDGKVLNDPTLGHLALQALSHAKAGADIVAPSDMMDGRVQAIRECLDQAGFEGLPIMSYSVKYASAFYGPFREAADSAPKSGDRRGYQMDPGNIREAVREAELDLEEGADIIMVKPAGPYLDVLREIRLFTERPLAAYQVSGEFAMLRAAGDAGLLDYKAAALESLLGVKRAGADLILTYLAPEFLRWQG